MALLPGDMRASIRQQLKHMRQQRGETVQTTATRAGLGIATWYALERGHDCRFSTFCAAARAFGRKLILAPED